MRQSYRQSLETAVLKQHGTLAGRRLRICAACGLYSLLRECERDLRRARDERTRERLRHEGAKWQTALDGAIAALGI